MDDMASQSHSPELRHLLMYIIDRADFHALPHFRSFSGRMLRYSAQDDSRWQVSPFQLLPIGRLIPSESEPVAFDHRIDCEIGIAPWWRLLNELPHPFTCEHIFGCYSEFSTLGSEHDVSSRALPHSTESSEYGGSLGSVLGADGASEQSSLG